MARVPRVLLLVCDGLGVGAAPDASEFGDEGSDSLGNCSHAVGGLSLPNLGAMGIGCLTDVKGVAPEPRPGTGHGRLAERSAAKDSATGHWEMAGLVTDSPFPLFPEGLPAEVIFEFERLIRRKVLGNTAASGTEIIERLGREHLVTGRPIVYTSGDSVFQIAAHEEVTSEGELYSWCEMARRMLVGPVGVARVIARPFAGSPGSFVRLPGRRDFAIPPTSSTLLDACAEAGVAVHGIGKIGDVFTMRGLASSVYASSDDDGIDRTVAALETDPSSPSLVFANLVDLDSKYGHRNDPEGYARCLEAVDARIPEILEAVGEGVMFLTGDHGCDPTTPSTDHSREMVPMLAGGLPKGPVDVGTRSTFADLGATIGELLGVSTEGLAGVSFAGELGLIDG